MADWISKPQSCPRSLPSVRWLPPIFVIVMETWLKQQAVSLTHDNYFSDLLPMPYPPRPHSSADLDQCLVSTAVTGKRVGSNGACFSPICQGSFCSFLSISQVSEDQGVEKEGLPSSRGRTLKGYTQLAHVLGWGFIALQWLQMRKEAIVFSHQNCPLTYRR